ncbi:MAG TPA: 4-(cytidine 5'-diphospho)-2-C-methyl-D-erythritol kinase [Candidatus Omnitrophica bacterium]|nr:4-(cytidine 5'-diphospho)-2-C-methyl-D-erythritol kinase [Candidatus Omnitrophota bacterium]
MREIKVFAPAKLNLYLDVLGKRPDGFHNIETIFEKIDLKDEIIIKEKGKGLKVKTTPSNCSQGRENIVYKAAYALFKEARVKLNLDIEIKKRIPVSAGLGGGSSDAASVLKAVNKIFKLGVPAKKLFSIARDIGKDVPFFMLNSPFAVAKGAGELLEKINLNKSLFHILIKPSIPLSTKLMYRRIDKCSFSTKPHSLKGTLNALKKMDVKALEKNYYNIFESALARDNVHINRAKAMLADRGAEHSLLSGSGPTVFCTFKDKEDAKAVFRKMPKDRDTSVFLVKTYKGGIYGDNRG